LALMPIRTIAVLTHPVQYYAAWFRWIHAHCPGLDLQVIYASRPTEAQQGVGFGRAFSWNVPLTDGYNSRVVREARPGDRFDAAHFMGLDVQEIGDAIRDAKPDVVIVFGWYSITLTRAIRAARALGVPVLYHGDTNLQSAPRGWRWPLWLAKTRRLLRMFDAYLSVGTRSAAFLRFFGAADDRIFFTPHAVDNDRFANPQPSRSAARRDARHSLGIPDGSFVVLFAGKLEEKKRPLDLVDAVGRMTPRPHLLVAGGGPLGDAVRTRSASLGVPLVMRGFVNQAEMPSVYAAADCLALPSDARETWGLVVNEAFAAGVPCVMADTVGCVPDLGGAETGGVYTTADPLYNSVFLAEALGKVREQIERGHDFGPACRAAAARHTCAVSAAGLERACQSLAIRGARPPAGEPRLRILACCGGMVLIGGLERMTFEILRHLRGRGVAVHCIVNWWDNDRIVAKAEQVGSSWSTGYYMHRLTRRAGVVGLLRQLADIVFTSGGLLRDAFAFRATHILVSDYQTVVRNAPALALLRLTGREVVLRLGNAPDQGRLYRAVWRFGVDPFVDRYVCNSQFTDQELAAHGIPERKRVTIVHTPPTRAVHAAVERDPGRVIYVGQLLPEKGLSILLDAMGLLVKKGRDVRLDVVGRIDGWVPPAHEPYRKALLARADEADLRGRVRFLGYREDVPALMAEASIHCCPSMRVIREGFGIVVIEAKRAGIPSVVLPSGNLPNLVRHGEDGWVCREETPEALAEGLEHFLDPQRLTRGMTAARSSAETFSRERFERSWNAVFAESA
jgi:glycosyltransferase involved in cell wall biosynthesis